MKSLGTKGQGENLIKLLVVAIIAVIALALVKSYFREASKTTKKSIDQIFTPALPGTSLQLPIPIALPLCLPIT